MWDDATRAVIRDQVSRLARLAEDIDAVSRAEEGRLALAPEQVDVSRLITAATAAVSGSYAIKKVSLDVAHLPVAAAVIDRTRMLQVLTNLLDNARRHTPSGGLVRVICTS
ncbi:hypothetical protein [Nocardioides convexus]|uniref:sensor histidine kinase n=1 Tax=Nocardioides convexus TaxID=2712224 RepID=UPI0024185982|nr:hypothetical protein [Nocardioides convexus]